MDLGNKIISRVIPTKKFDRVFNTVKETKEEITGIVDLYKANAPKFFKGKTKDFVEDIKELKVLTNSEGAKGDVMMFPNDISSCPYKFKLSFFKYERPVPESPPTYGTPEATIYLPIPKSLIEAHATTWAQVGLGSILGSVLNSEGGQEFNRKAQSAFDAVGRADDVLDLFKDKEDGSKSDFLSSFDSVTKKSVDPSLGSSTTSLASTIRGGLYDSGFMPSMQEALNQTLGNTPNPFMSHTFRGPNFATHSFSWVLSAQDSQESKNLKLLFREIKKRALPRYTKDSNHILYDFPDVCQIELIVGKQDGVEQNLFLMKRAVVQNVGISYISQGEVAFHDDGTPVSYTLSLEFMEIEFITSEDFNDEAFNANPARTLELGSKVAVPNRVETDPNIRKLDPLAAIRPSERVLGI